MALNGDRTRLTTSSGVNYDSINSPEASINDSVEASLKVKNVNPLVALYREVASGKQKLSAVLLYSCIAAMGAVLTGFSLGYSSLAQLDLTNKVGTFAVPSDGDFKYIGVRVRTCVSLHF